MPKQRSPGPAPEADPLADPRLRRRLWLARAAVAWERLWPRLWRPTAVAGVFLAVALLDLLPRLPSWLHAAVLAGFAGAFLLAAGRGSRPRWPDAAEGRRRLERDSGLRHRPLTGLDDSLALGGDDPAAAALWAAHRSRLRAALSRLRVGLPRAGLAPVDPLALRAIPVLLLAIGLTAAGAQAPTRLGRALLPDFSGTQAPPPSVSVWIDPPGYTGAAPRVLAPGPDAPAAADAVTPPADKKPGETAVPVPEGSRVLVRVDGLARAPELALGDRTLDFARVEGDVWRAGGKVDKPLDSPLAVRQGDQTLARWPLTVVFDQPPTAAFAALPEAGRRHALAVRYKARDDYGLASLRLEIERSGDGPGAPIRREIPVTSGEEDDAEGGVSGVSYHDLTAHPWAGLEVQARLTAEDRAGQTGHSRSLRVTLPERPFTHPVAKVLVRLRKDLSREPNARGPVVTGLQALQRRPRAFQGEVAVALALRLSERRLVYDARSAAVAAVQDLMWQTALALEDGELSIAERELRRAQEALERALAREDVGEAELDRLMARLETAMDRFLKALRKHQAERLAEDGVTPSELPPDARVLDRQALEERLRRLREMTETGARDAAREMLAELRGLLENLDLNAEFARQGEALRQAQALLDRLDGLSQAQQALLDESFRGGQRQAGEAPDQPRAGEGAAARQEELRRELGQLLRDLGGALGRIPGPLGEAEQAMRRATRALEQNQPGAAVGPQGEAVEKLRQGRRAMQQAFQQRLRPGPGRDGQGRRGRAGSSGRDPLGRPTRETGRGGQDTGDVEIPSEGEIQRAREILDTLRRRAGERDRPELEQEYIRRLLDRF